MLVKITVFIVKINGEKNENQFQKYYIFSDFIYDQSLFNTVKRAIIHKPCGPLNLCMENV